MGEFLKILKYTFVKPELGLAFVWKKLSAVIPAKLYLSVLYRFRFGYWMDFDNPKTFNEKLQWLKLYDHRPEYIKLVDKYEAKKIIGELIGNEYIIPTLGVWNKVDDIDFDSLPNQFVLKCTHDSGGIVICKDKCRLNIKYAKNKLNKCLKTNYYNEGKEWPYKSVPRRIIAEKLIEPPQGIKDLFDYKFFCFEGKVCFFKIDYGRYVEHHANYYSIDGEQLPFGEASCPPSNHQIKIPGNIKQMISLAERIAMGYPFMRVDFYEVEGIIMWGECTLYPASGFGKFTSEEYDDYLGSMIQLKGIKKK